MLNGSGLDTLDDPGAAHPGRSGRHFAQTCFRILGPVEVWAGERQLELGGHVK